MRMVRLRTLSDAKPFRAEGRREGWEWKARPKRLEAASPGAPSGVADHGCLAEGQSRANPSCGLALGAQRAMLVSRGSITGSRGGG